MSSMDARICKVVSECCEYKEEKEEKYKCSE